MKKKIIKSILVIIGFVILLIYLLPLVAGILNAGNAFGICVGVLVAFVGLKLDRIFGIAKTLCKRKWGKLVVTIICIISVVFVSAFSVTMISIVNYAQYTAADESTVIVLGCKVNGSQPSLMLRWRCNSAYKYLSENENAVAILSGGQGSNENISEAECMYNVLVEYGIEPSRLYLEDTSTSTEENIRNSKRIIDNNGLSTNVAIATSDYHEKRASIIAKKNGLISSSIPAYGDKYSRPTFYTREVFGVWVQMLK